MSAQRIILAAGLAVCSGSNGLIAFSYAGNLLHAIFAAVGAAIPIFVLWWWASARSNSATEQRIVFGTVLLSMVVGAVLFMTRAMAIGTFQPEMSMFPLAAPALFLVVVFLLMILCTLISFFAAGLAKHNET